MGLFNSIEINPNIIPFIEKGEGVGIVKVNGLGKCSAIVDNNSIILDSYESASNGQTISFDDINFLSYDEGNFINEPKFNIGVSGRQFVLAGVDNNDDELRRFYNTVLNIKEQQRVPNNQQGQNTPHSGGMPHPNPNITNPNKKPYNPMKSNSQPNDFHPQNQHQNDIPNNMPINDNLMDEQSMDPVDEIRRYYSLKEDGIITEEEFEKKKKQLLGI